MKRIVAIDGACRRNGKPDCVSAGGVFIRSLNDPYGTLTLSFSEKASTNQRGEMLALLGALHWLSKASPSEVQIITDSEYLFNAMTKGWHYKWADSGYTTAMGTPVKNADIWKDITTAMDLCQHQDIVFYHVKGHCIPFGKVTASNLLRADKSGRSLFDAVSVKFDSSLISRAALFEDAQQLSEKNNGFRLPEQIFKDFVVANTVVDAVATEEVEKADREI